MKRFILLLNIVLFLSLLESGYGLQAQAAPACKAFGYYDVSTRFDPVKRRNVYVVSMRIRNIDTVDIHRIELWRSRQAPPWDDFDGKRAPPNWKWDLKRWKRGKPGAGRPMMQFLTPQTTVTFPMTPWLTLRFEILVDDGPFLPAVGGTIQFSCRDRANIVAGPYTALRRRRGWNRPTTRDRNRDGKVDEMFYDWYGGGNKTILYRDTNFDGNWDYIEKDINNDGTADEIYKDYNFNGINDYIWINWSFDGTAERVLIDRKPPDGILNEDWEDCNNDGVYERKISRP
jgi:hypothetical protein